MSLLTAGLSLAGGLAAALSHRARALRVVGAPLHRSERGTHLRGLGALFLVLVALATRAGSGDAPPWALPILAATLVCTWLLPQESEFVYGEGGLSVGWTIVGWSDLEEWRMTGEHLRFRLNGRWRALPIPAAKREELRAILEEKSAAAESPFAS